MCVTGVVQDNFAHCGTPTDVFLALLGEDMVEHITYQSNLYATQKNKSLNLKEHELLCTIGINFVMGYHSLPAIEHYWSTASDMNVAAVSSTMPRARFQEILSNLHANDNKTIPTGCKDKLYKLRPIIDGLNKQFQESYYGTREVSIDESVIKFKGRSTLKQYNPMKPIKRGYKLWCSCDQKGYTLEFSVYQGKDEELEEEFGDYGLGERVVLKLTKRMWGKERIIFFDNYFSSLRLLERLKVEGTLACGTIRATRKGGPTNMAADKTLKKGDSDIRFSSSDIGYFKWMDNKVVNFVSNFHGSETGSVLRTSKDGSRQEVKCPTVVCSYNKYMGGVDHADRLRALYCVDRKSMKWWHRLFWGFFDIALVNAFVIYCNLFEETDMLSFRRSVAQGLLAQRAPPSKRGRPSKPTSPEGAAPSKRRKSDFSVPKDVRHGNRGIHWIKFVTARGRCEVCSSRKIQSRPHSRCSHCKVFLCVNDKKNCFAEYHNVDV